MSDYYDQLGHFKDQVVYLFQNPSYVKSELANDHQLLVEVIGVVLLTCLLLLALFKPATPTALSDSESKESAPPSPLTPKKMQPSAEPQAWIKRERPSIHELSQEEEQALNQAMALAGKQALAEATGTPHQAEFFQTNEPAEAAKKMFARQKKEAKNTTEAQPPSKLEFIILYFMAPRSLSFKNETFFQLLRELGLSLNDQRVFEYQEGPEVQFYVSSALKPGHFDLQTLNASVPGLSFVLDLKNLQNAQSAFNRMLEIIHTLSQNLKGDILDESRQRLTQTSVSTYMARIKAFTHLQQSPP